MLAKRIVPCLDMTKGRVVKGIQFINFRDAGDPVKLAKKYKLKGVSIFELDGNGDQSFWGKI